MGQRQLGITPSLVAGLLMVESDHNNILRAFSVENGLPDDVRFIEALYKTDRSLYLILESDQWAGISEIPLEPPRVRVHFGLEAIMEAHNERSKL